MSGFYIDCRYAHIRTGGADSGLHVYCASEKSFDEFEVGGLTTVGRRRRDRTPGRRPLYAAVRSKPGIYSTEVSLAP